MAEQPPQQGSNFLQDSNKVVFICNSTKKSLRITDEDVVDGNAEAIQGTNAIFIVHVRRPGVIVLQSNKHTSRFLSILDDKLTTDDGGVYSEFTIHTSSINPNMISLESCFYPGQHVGIQNNGNAQTPSATGRGGNASYTVELVEAAGPSSSLYLQHCNTVSLIAASTGKPLRIRDDVVDGKGSRGGAWTVFIVHVRRPGVILLQSKMDKKPFLAIKDNKLTYGNGGPDSEFIVETSVHNARMVGLESFLHRGRRVGIVGDGNAKSPSQTGLGAHGSFTVELLESAAPNSDQLMQHGNTVSLISASSGRPMRIRDGVVDGHGQKGGAYTRFVIHVRRPGVIVLQSTHNMNHYLAIKNDRLTFGGGGVKCEFTIHTSDISSGMISLEASNQPGSFVGILHNGQMKNPRHTKRGRDGSFTVVFVELSNGLTGAEMQPLPSAEPGPAAQYLIPDGQRPSQGAQYPPLKAQYLALSEQNTALGRRPGSPGPQDPPQPVTPLPDGGFRYSSQVVRLTLQLGGPAGPQPPAVEP